MSKDVKGVPENSTKLETNLVCLFVNVFGKPWLIFGGVPREGIEGEPGVVGELFKESEDCR